MTSYNTRNATYSYQTRMRVRQSKEYNIGENIQRIRREKHISQQETVDYLQRLGLDISRQYYSQIERGIANVKVEILLALCNLFDCEIQDFFEGIEFECNL